jgi:hypothetical protein
MSQSSVAVPISTHLSDAERAVRIDLAACYRLSHCMVGTT